MDKGLMWLMLAAGVALGCNTEKPKDKPGLVSIPAVEQKETPEVAVNPDTVADTLEAEPTKEVQPTGHWTVAPPAGCRVGRVKLGAGGVVKAKMKAALKARSGLAMMAQALLDEVDGRQAAKPTVEETIDANGKKMRVVTTTTASIDLVGVRQMKSQVEKGAYTAMFCLDPADVTASFRQMEGLSDTHRTTLVAKAEKAYGGLATALSNLDGKLGAEPSRKAPGDGQ